MHTTENLSDPELQPLITVLSELKKEKKLDLAILFGSYAKGMHHHRSDIDLAISIPPVMQESEMEIIDRILMTSERQIALLRLDDVEESPLVVQEALKGIQLVEPDYNTYYSVADRVLHESESIRGRRQRYV